MCFMEKLQQVRLTAGLNLASTAILGTASAIFLFEAGTPNHEFSSAVFGAGALCCLGAGVLNISRLRELKGQADQTTLKDQ